MPAGFYLHIYIRALKGIYNKNVTNVHLSANYIIISDNLNLRAIEYDRVTKHPSLHDMKYYCQININSALLNKFIIQLKNNKSIYRYKHRQVLHIYV